MIHNGHRFLGIVLGFSFKKLLAFSGFLSVSLGLGLGEGLTSQWGSAGLAGVVAGVFTTSLVAILYFVPKYMEQRRKSAWSSQRLNEESVDKIIQRFEELMTRQREFHERESQFYKRVIAEKELVATLERRSKHKMHSEWTGALAYARVLELQLAELGKKPAVQLNPKTYDQVVGEEDKQIAALAENRVADAALSQPAL